MIPLKTPEPTNTFASGEFYIFARFHARPGSEAAVAAIRDVLAPTRKEAGCIRARAFRSIRDARLFFIHSRWRDEAAFEFHRTLPHTLRFIELVGTLIDHDLDVARTMLIDLLNFPYVPIDGRRARQWRRAARILRWPLQPSADDKDLVTVSGCPSVGSAGNLVVLSSSGADVYRGLHEPSNMVCSTMLNCLRLLPGKQRSGASAAERNS